MWNLCGCLRERSGSSGTHYVANLFQKRVIGG